MVPMNGETAENIHRVDAAIATAYERIEALNRLGDERDRRYTDLRSADAAAVSAALAAAEKAVAAALAAAEKATEKAEMNDAHYREQQNEWRNSLSDILARAVPVSQYNTDHSSLIDKMNEQNRSQTAAVAAGTEVAGTAMRAQVAILDAKIDGLTASRDTRTGVRRPIIAR